LVEAALRAGNPVTEIVEALEDQDVMGVPAALGHLAKVTPVEVL